MELLDELWIVEDKINTRSNGGKKKPHLGSRKGGLTRARIID